jgi:hypothetical protein
MLRPAGEIKLSTIYLLTIIVARNIYRVTAAANSAWAILHKGEDT